MSALGIVETGYLANFELWIQSCGDVGADFSNYTVLAIEDVSFVAAQIGVDLGVPARPLDHGCVSLMLA